MDGLIARPGGVLVRAGHTEGSVDLCRLAGLREVAVICEVLNEDGTMARLAGPARVLRAGTALKMYTIADLIEYRRRREKLVRREIALKLPTEFGDVRPVRVHVAGGPGAAPGPDARRGRGAEAAPAWCRCRSEPVLVRMHSECLTGDVLHSTKCDCGPQLKYAMQQVAEAGRGVIVYMRQEGRGIGLLEQAQGVQAPAGGGAGHGGGEPPARASPRTCGTSASGRRSCTTWASATSAC